MTTRQAGNGGRRLVTEGVEVRGPVVGRFAEILTPDALAFVALLQREFGRERETLLSQRVERRARMRAGEMPNFLSGTRHIREGDWKVAPVPADLRDRRVEITGPVDRKMIINALNSGASVFMADFEDAASPTWETVIDGQVNLVDAVNRAIEYASPDGKVYRLREQPATLLVRPRGWHLVDRHLLVDGRPISGSFLDFGLYVFHNASNLLERGTGPYFYLPKLENHREARLWNGVFLTAEDMLGIPRGSIKATVLIEHILAAFEMEEILYELRDHSGGLNAGRWDYIFSIIKTFWDKPEFVLPDRARVTMTVPFMRAYTELLVKTCHARGAYAIGGMAAFIPSRRDPAINESALAQVRSDKVRESNDGFDGTWVAHPDLVNVAMDVFTAALQGQPNQLNRQRPEVSVEARELLDIRVPGGEVTEGGVRGNVRVALLYLDSWLSGVGAAAIDNLMEDAATAEIARSQICQWVHHGARLSSGTSVSRSLVQKIEEEELDRIRREIGDKVYNSRRFPDARRLFEDVALGEPLKEFLTIPAYDRLS